MKCSVSIKVASGVAESTEDINVDTRYPLSYVPEHMAKALFMIFAANPAKENKTKEDFVTECCGKIRRIFEIPV